MSDVASSTAGVDRQSLSMAEFNNLLNFEYGGSPTTHALIIRDDNDLLIYAQRARNENFQWEVQDYRIVGENVVFNTQSVDRASIAAILLEEFDGDRLTTDEEYAQHRPIRHGVPVAVAGSNPAVAAYLYVRGETRKEIAEEMDVTKPTVDEYLSRFRRQGIGIPKQSDAPEPGEIVERVPPKFDPGRQQIVADGGTTEPGSEGSRYVRETGEGFAGVFAVGNGTTEINMVSVGLNRRDDIVSVADQMNGTPVVRLMRPPAEQGDRVLQRSNINSDGYYSVGGKAQSHMDVEPGDDVRLYRDGDGTFILTAAAEDPLVDVRTDGCCGTPKGGGSNE